MATRRRSSSKTVKKSDVITEEDVNAAVSVIQRDYYQDVRGIADDVEKAIKDGEIRDDEKLTEYIESSVDGSARVIYTFQSQLGLLVSGNSDAYEEEFGEAPPDIMRAMYMAMVADVREAVGDVEFDED